MTRLGGTVPPIVQEIRNRLSIILRDNELHEIDANSKTTGKDFLTKIWKMIVEVPIGIAIVYKGIPRKTLSNIYYELGLMQGIGKETLVINEVGVRVPSDFVRTEYVSFGDSFDEKVQAFIDNLWERANYFATVADALDRNPLLSIDYFRRAYLLTGNDAYRESAAQVLGNAGLGERAKNSVEMILASFCK